METNLVRILKSKMDTYSITITELERKAGLKTNAVRNILTARSRNPNIETLKSLAIALECSLEELTSFDELVDHTLNDFKKHRIENINLYCKVVEYVLKEYNNKNIAPTIDQLNNVVTEVYSYFHSKNKEVDLDFIEWTVEKDIKQREKSY
jgi:transcriptional regulator with XRE-family HTH domain